MIKTPHGWGKMLYVIIAFIIVGLFAANNAWGFEKPQVKLGLGQTFANSNLMQGEASIDWYDWEAGLQLMEAGQTIKGDQDQLFIVFLTKSIRPDWCFVGCYYQKIGLSYVPNSNLVGDLNYRLGVGVSFNVFELEYVHYSSAGIQPINSGVDGWIIALKIPIGNKY